MTNYVCCIKFVSTAFANLISYALYALQSGLTALHLAAQEERVNAAEVLAKHDANLDQQTKV